MIITGGVMRFILILFPCVFLYGGENRISQTYTPHTIPKLDLLVLGKEDRSEAGPTEPSSPLSRELSLDEEDADFFASWDTHGVNNQYMELPRNNSTVFEAELAATEASLDNFQFDDAKPIPTRRIWSVPFHVGKINVSGKPIPLPNVGTQAEIEERKRDYMASRLYVNEQAIERTMEILKLKVTEPQKP